MNVYDEYTPPSHGVRWYLRPGREGDVDLPECAYGKIHDISWGQAPPLKQPVDDVIEIPAEPHAEAENPPQSLEAERLVVIRDLAKTARYFLYALAAITLVLLVAGHRSGTLSLRSMRLRTIARAIFGTVAFATVKECPSWPFRASKSEVG
jgi:hypothetical protein